jgi:WD40 repeat protein
MSKLQDENILKEIFSSIKYIQLKNLLQINQNNIVSRQMLKLISYKSLFKAIDESRITLKLENCFDSIAILANGDIATITGNQALNIWSIETYKCIHTSIIDKFSLMISLPNGILAIARQNYNQVKLLDSNNNFKIINTIFVDYCVNNMFLLSGDNLLVSTYSSSVYDLIYIGYFEIINCDNNYHKITNIGEHIFSLANVPNDKIVASSYDKMVIIDSLDDYKSKPIKKLDKNICALAYQNGCLISASSDCSYHTIDIWVDIESDIKCVKSMKINNLVNCLLSLPGGFFASGTYDIDSEIIIWDLSNYECINTINLAKKEDIGSLLLLKDNRILSYSYTENSLFIFGH